MTGKNSTVILNTVFTLNERGDKIAKLWYDGKNYAEQGENNIINLYVFAKIITQKQLKHFANLQKFATLITEM